MLARRWTLLTAALAILVGYVLSIANLRFGDLNQDEGWYLLAARSVSEGKLPYRDFAFTQGPMLPMVYSLANPLVAKFGVAGGRIFTSWLAAAAALLATFLAGRIAPPRHRHVARAVAITLIAVNAYHSYFTAIVKTYSLCALFLAAAFFALSFVTEKRGWIAAALGGFLLAAAAATRISSGAALAATGLVFLLNRKILGDSKWISFGIGGALGLAIFLLPWLFIAPVGFKFGIFEYHTLRSAGGLLPALIYKAGFISRLVNGWLFAIIAAAALIAFRFLFPTLGNSATANFQPLETRGNPVALAIWLSIGAISLVHFSAPFPYDDYEVPLFPLFAAALAAGLVKTISSVCDESRLPRACGWLLAATFLGSALAAGSSPMNMDLFVRGRDRIWWRMKDEPSLAKLHRVAKIIRTEFPNAKEMLTQDSYLAVETGMRVPPGFEMGPFSYFPKFSDGRAAQLHVLNEKSLRDALQNSKAPIAAISGYGLSIACPEVSELSKEEQQELQARLRSRYALMGETPNFGQGNSTLKLFQLLDGAPWRAQKERPDPRTRFEAVP